MPPWLDFAKDCVYLKIEAYDSLKKKREVVGEMYGVLLKKSTSFILKT